LPWEARYDIKPGIIVNGTPVGMHPNVNETPYAKEKLALLMKSSDSVIVFDTVYNPEQTLLVKDATNLGATVVSGVDMFVRQAAYQYKLFTGRTPSTDLMRKTLRVATSPIKYRVEEDEEVEVPDTAD
jgi:3-dehydroquinate dehydratase / shikimate dehydrogenase